MKPLVGVLLLSLTLLTSAPALASAPEEAVRHFDAGRDRFKNRDYAGAVTELEASLAVYASPNTRLYLARALRELDRLPEAAIAYQTTVTEARQLGATDPEYVKTGNAATAELTEVERRIAWVTVHVTSDRPASAPVHVTSPAGLDLPLPVSGGRVPVRPGKTSLSARSADGQQDGPLIVTAVAGERVELTFQLARPGTPRRSATSPWVWVGYGLGAALAGASVATWLVSDGDYSDLKDSDCAARFTSTCDDTKSHGRTFETIAVTAGIAAIVVTAAATVGLLTSKERRVSAQAFDGRFRF